MHFYHSYGRGQITRGVPIAVLVRRGNEVAMLGRGGGGVLVFDYFIIAI